MKNLFLLTLALFSTFVFAEQFSLDRHKIEITAPSGFKLKTVKTAVLAEQQGALRSAESIRISFFKQPLPARLNKKTIGPKTVEYITESQTGGSGGTEFITVVYEKTRSKIIRYEHHSQSENESPDLKYLWEIVENTKVIK